MLQGDLSKLLAQGVRTLYPLKKIEIRSSEVLGIIADEAPATEVPAATAEGGPSAPEAPAGPEASGETPAA